MLLTFRPSVHPGFGTSDDLYQLSVGHASGARIVPAVRCVSVQLADNDIFCNRRGCRQRASLGGISATKQISDYGAPYSFHLAFFYSIPTFARGMVVSDCW